MNALISVIVPVYNCEKYLNECLTSLLKQSCEAFELLLIDDGSSDRSGQICDDYAALDRRVRVLHQSNGGVSNARNVGITNAKGEWIMFVDSDDYVSETFIEDALYQVKTVSEPDSIFFFGYNRVENGRCNPIVLEAAYFDSTQKGEAIKYLHIDRDSLGYICSKIFNISIVNENRIRFDEQLALSEDLLFTLEYLKYCNHIYITPLCNYYYRIDNDESLSKKRIDYLKGRSVIEQTYRMLENLIGNAEIFSLFERGYLQSNFHLLLNLCSATNASYGKEFILKEINGYKHRNNLRVVKLKNKSYVFLFWAILHLSSFWVYLIYRMYFRLKVLKSLIN